MSAVDEEVGTDLRRGVRQSFVGLNQFDHTPQQRVCQVQAKTS